jgi:hypothetical protein
MNSELQEKLRAPLPEKAIKQHPTKIWMSSINAAFVVERLNDVFGEDGWQAEYEIIEGNPQQKMVVVRGKFFADVKNEGKANTKIYREAFGGNDNPDRGDAYKGACTDALGKIASQLGIAQEVYKGMLDEVQAPPANAGKGKRGQFPAKERRTYESIEGVVTRCERMSPNSLWLMVNSLRLHANTKPICDQLANSMSKKVELNAFWGHVGKNKTPMLIISGVLGIYEPVPRDPEYVKEPTREREPGDDDEDLSQHGLPGLFK